ncbi:hypothetical protein RvY_17623 [Ramazzottius varieornatus]|uniref:Uncharacterized protein n=1 Tax=Ramazzottius varieornatus TaxID=947166 RepID=A0A1D1W2T3_RAMVA|nr:hypothetical protein RvY_17623 [Ramazzottius varieornatus]
MYYSLRRHPRYTLVASKSHRFQQIILFVFLSSALVVLFCCAATFLARRFYPLYFALVCRVVVFCIFKVLNVSAGHRCTRHCAQHHPLVSVSVCFVLYFLYYGC